MKKPHVLVMGMLALALTFGCLLTACSDGNDDAAEQQQQLMIAMMAQQQQEQQAAEDAARSPAFRTAWYSDSGCTSLAFELKTGGAFTGSDGKDVAGYYWEAKTARIGGITGGTIYIIANGKTLADDGPTESYMGTLSTDGKTLTVLLGSGFLGTYSNTPVYKK